MNPPPNREVVIFNAALDLPASQREGYLQEACADDPALRLHIEDLLRVHEQAGAFMETAASEAQASPNEVEQGATINLTIAPSEKPGDRIGRYKLLQQIGEGGCGVVYMAEQKEPVRRRVALKIIKLGMDTKQVIARFEAERQALALMDHPNIARVFDAGATETGRPYFVMELVRGVKITNYCDQSHFSTRERLGLFIMVCQAIQHAHQKGIIHRDIKPSNILVTLRDGVPVPKVIDFGIAKATTGQPLTDKTLFTSFEQFIGTPAYMSPEQAELSEVGVDTRSDIYSLGVLLYELLTGRTPFDTKVLVRAGLDELRRIIRETEPVRPSTRLRTMLVADLTEVAKHRRTQSLKLTSLIRGDLDWIVMKALEKNRARRYETANGMAMDVRRYLDDQPVVARPPGNLYLFEKLVRRNKLTFAAVTAVAALLILGLCGATMEAVRVKRGAREIRRAKDDATEKLWASYLAESRATRSSGRTGQRFASLDAVRKAATIRPDIVVRNEAIASLAMSDLRVSQEVVLKGHEADDLVCFDPNMESYAVGEETGSITIRSVKDDRALASLPAPGKAVRWIYGFSPNSRYLKVSYWRRREGGTVWVWDVHQQRVVLRDSQADVCFSSDSRFSSRCNPDGTLSIHELDSGKELKRLPGTRKYDHVLLNPKNTRLACWSQEDSRVEIRAVESQDTLTLTCPTGVASMGWSPDGKRLATACMDYRIYVWNAETGQRQAVLDGHTQYIQNLSFNHAGNLLASSSFEGLVRLWDPDSGVQIASHPGGGWQVQFSPDDRYLLGWQNLTRYGSLEVAYSHECRRLYVPRDGTICSGPDFSVDGRMLVAGTDSRVFFWDVFSGKEIGSFTLTNCDKHIFHPDGRGLIVTDRLGGVRLRSIEHLGGPASCAFRLGSGQPFHDAQMVSDAALDLDGRHLAVIHQEQGECLIFDLQDPAAKPVILRPHPLVGCIALSPDGRWAATSSWHNPLVKVWDAHSGELVHDLPMPARTKVTFSPDGHWLATSTTEYQLWEVGSWQPKGPPVAGQGIPEWNFTAFSPDGRVMARAAEESRIQLLETATGKPLATLEAPVSSGISTFQFSPDGSRLAAMQRDQQVQLWDLRLIRQELQLMGLDWNMPAFPTIEKGLASEPVTLTVESEL